MSTSLILFISAAGVIQAILLAGLLYFHPRSDRSVNIFLSLHILTVSIFMLMPVFQYLFSWQSIIHLIPFQFLIGPFLYLYVRSFRGPIHWQKQWIHFLLFAAVMIVMYVFYYPWIKKFPGLKEPSEEILLAPLTLIIVILRNLQMLFYYLLARQALSRYQRSIQHLYSETSRINLSWVRWLLNGFLFLIITVFVLVYFITTHPENFGLFILINTAIITPYIYLVAFKGMGQPTLWQLQPGKTKEKIEHEIIEAEMVETNQEQVKQGISIKGLPETKATEFITAITRLMEQEKIYQEPELTLQMLAEKMGIPAYQASQVINEGMNKSFYDLINGYRVEEAKRLLLDDKNKNYTILSVGFEAGFNSKTTFHTVFKKFTGLTPTEYRERNKSLVDS
ncbi:MAG TPA: helix-turn-helix domain-containing protein [Chitinophagaceae bacterium]